MDEQTRRRLEAAGFRVGSASEFLGLSNAENALVELKLALSAYLRQRRLQKGSLAGPSGAPPWGRVNRGSPGWKPVTRACPWTCSSGHCLRWASVDRSLPTRSPIVLPRALPARIRSARRR